MLNHSKTLFTSIVECDSYSPINGPTIEHSEYCVSLYLNYNSHFVVRDVGTISQTIQWSIIVFLYVYLIVYFRAEFSVLKSIHLNDRRGIVVAYLDNEAGSQYAGTEFLSSSCSIRCEAVKCKL